MARMPAIMDFRPIQDAQPHADSGSRSNAMIVTFITEDGDGFHTYTGHVVSRGPSTIVVLLTEPFGLAGRSVQFPMTAVVSEKVVSA
jgi:hypothetical protein